MSRKKIINPNMIANPIILPDAKDMVDSHAIDIKDDSHKVSPGQLHKK